MPIIEHNIIINRPIHEVFTYVGDFRNAPKWQPDVSKVWQTEDKPRVGVMITEKRNFRVLFYQLDLNADIVEYHLNKKIQYKGTTGYFPIVGTLSFEPSGRNTKIVETLDVHMWGPHRLLSSFVSGALKRRADKTWNNLKQILESAGAR